MTDTTSRDLIFRTENAVEQLTRYGGTVFDESVLSVLEALTDVNDDLCNGRSPTCIKQSVEKVRKALDELLEASI